MTDLSPRRGVQPLAKASNRPGPAARKLSRVIAVLNDPNFAVVVIVALTGLLATLAMTVLFSSGATEALTQF